MKRICFTKMAAGGNDFIVVDNRAGTLKKNLPQTAKRFCDRKHGIGGDGLLLLEKSKKSDIRMRIFNPDGSEAEMCGNGVRCLARFAVDKKIAKNIHCVESSAGIIEVEVRRSQVKAHLTDPKDFKPHVDLSINGRREKVHFINTGVPHAVIFEPMLADVPVNERGREVRRHAYFAPKGTNVNFVKVKNRHSIQVRTYERGVESETLACGTGSTASAIVSASLEGLHSPVRVRTAGGEILKIYFKKENGFWKNVYLEGEVKKIFEGSVAL